ncbi:hypothetical protein J2W25_001569 [Variovorax boronicumulans]|uniref:TRAP C4-dicarboxylate transport system permease DctM subunit domain-containing protein n=1 Tax=Variovorax boronicumulans TaxID=436515 RepID=A0AAW8DT99_9BURK|nr:hypothetical protein [Variovorax boronicumulans]MDP9876569.1 hypothetical protein [Variovorax boronicumulans]MDP9922554.1 hypothetical protein [Variovorax boronicumulans]
MFGVLGILAISIAILTLLALFVDMAITGVPRLSTEFLTSFPSRRAANPGILSS